MELSARAKNLKPSPTLALAGKARALKAQGKDIISLTVGEPDWDTFESVKQKAIEAITSGQTKYAPSEGIPELREAIAKKTSLELGVSFTPQQVTVTAGGKMIIFSALQTLIGPGDEVIIPSPFWVSYPEMVELADGKPVIVNCGASDNYKIGGKKLAQAITPKTKAVILNSPSNPTGIAYTLQELKDIGEVVKKNPQVTVLSDDIYNRLTFSTERQVTFNGVTYPLATHLLHACPEIVAQVLVINGMSKTYSMTGWRLGWALGPVHVIKAMTDYLSQSVSCASPFTQIASVHAILDCDKEVNEALARLKSRLTFAQEEFAANKSVKVVKPDGAFYIWLDVSESMHKKGLTTDAWSSALLEQKNVLVVPGQHFGMEGFVRLSVALKEDRLREAILRIRDFS